MPYPQGAYEVPEPNHLFSIINNLQFYQKNEKMLNFSGSIFNLNGDLKYLVYLYDYYREQMIRALLK